jgi:hypothetical protein
MTRNSFSKSVPHLQIAWDATSLAKFMGDPATYYYEIIEGWKSRWPSPVLHFGTYLHAALETYDKRRFGGATVSDAIDAAFDTAIAQTAEHFTCPVHGEIPRSEVDEMEPDEWDFPMYSHRECGKVVTYLPTLDGMAEYGKTEDKNKRTRKALLRAVVWYGEEYGDDDPVTVHDAGGGTPAVELSFRMPLEIKTPDGEPYILCGHMDGVCEYDGRVFVRERKTTAATLGKYYMQRFSPNPQVSTYALAARAVLDRPATGVLLEATQTAVGFSRFHRSFVDRTPAQNDEWLETLQWYIKDAERMALEGFWPINEANQMLYGGNTFRDIFAKDPAVREGFLRQKFWQAPEAERWDPIASR